MNISFHKEIPNDTTPTCLPVMADLHFTPIVEVFNKNSSDALQKSLNFSSFKGKFGQSLPFPTLEGAKGPVILFGLGEAAQLNAHKATLLGGKIFEAVSGLETEEITIYISGIGAENQGEIAANIAYGFQTRSFKFDKYKTPAETPSQDVKHVHIVTDAVEEAEHAYAYLGAELEGANFTRTLMCEPPNQLYPETMAAELSKLSSLGVKVEVLSEKDMEKLGMGGLLGVGQGSSKESKLVVLEWNGGKEGEPPLALVGKGVTFDTGGISIKPSAKMDEMKMDMGGAAVVAGAMKTLALRKAKVNVVGVVGLAENMPDGNAIRPGDILKTMSGKTIEVLNTDAEGRVVLADALWYTQERFKPSQMIDFATLTMAIVIALGQYKAGLFSNDDELAEALSEAGQESGDFLWRLPLGDDYDDDINTPNADVKNTGANGAGSITAAQFLQRFVGDTKWAHIDIAGIAWCTKPHPLTGKNPTGYGVRLIDTLVQKYYES